MCCSQDASLGGARPADSLSRQLAVPLICLVGELESPKGKTDPRGSSGRDNTTGRHHFCLKMTMRNGKETSHRE